MKHLRSHVPTDPLEHHRRNRQVWQTKPVIRACYAGWAKRLAPYRLDGVTVEIGGGTGCFKSLWPDTIATDVVPTPHADALADACQLPFANASVANLLSIDVLHHLSDPHRFFDEATRVLRPGGRILTIEPYITWGSGPAYRLLHHEDIWFGGYHRERSANDPWAGNMAMANLLFQRELPDWPCRHPQLTFLKRHRFSLLDFQLAGGFQPYAFVRSVTVYNILLRLDRLLDVIAPLAGFRILVVIEKH